MISSKLFLVTIVLSIASVELAPAPSSGFSITPSFGLGKGLSFSISAGGGQESKGGWEENNQGWAPPKQEWAPPPKQTVHLPAPTFSITLPKPNILDLVRLPKTIISKLIQLKLGLIPQIGSQKISLKFTAPQISLKQAEDDGWKKQTGWMTYQPQPWKPEAQAWKPPTPPTHWKPPPPPPGWAPPPHGHQVKWAKE